MTKKHNQRTHCCKHLCPDCPFTEIQQRKEKRTKDDIENSSDSPVELTLEEETKKEKNSSLESYWCDQADQLEDEF